MGKLFLPTFWAMLIPLVIGAIFGYWLRRARYRQVTRRVVETSTDESSRISTLADTHAADLHARETAHGKAMADLSTREQAGAKALADLQARHVALTKELETERDESQKQKAHAVTLLSQVSDIEPAKARERSLEASLAEWKSKYELAESARVKAAADVARISADHAKVELDWKARFANVESAQSSADAKLEQAAADHERVLHEWRVRAERAEADLTRSRGELEKSRSDHDRTLADWRSRYDSAEKQRLGAVAEAERSRGEFEVQLREWRAKAESAEGSLVKVQGLLDTNTEESAKVNVAHDRAVDEWRLRAERAEADLASARAARETELAAAGERERDDAARVAVEHDAALAKVRADLEAQIARAREDHDRLVSTLRDEHTQRLATLRGEFDAQRGKDDAAHNDALARLRSELTSVRDAHEHDLVSLRGQHQQTFGALKSDHDTLSARLESLTGQHSTLQLTHDGQSAELARVRAELAEATAGPDDLLVIEGVGPKINMALNAAGIRRYKHVAGASEAELRAALEASGIHFAPSVTTWSKQASFLVAGDRAGFEQYVDYLVAGQDPAALGGRELSDGEVEVIPAGSDASGGVRLLADGQDDLTRIEGIGPVIDKALRNAGITTFLALSQSSDDRLRAALEAAGVRFAPSLGTWAEQARLLANGDEAGFAKYVEHLVAGRDPSKVNG